MRKAIILLGSFVSIFGIVACQAIPSHEFAATEVSGTSRSPASGGSEATFAKVHKDAEELKLFGYDTLYCTDSTQTLVLGGVSFWNSPMKIIWYRSGGRQAVKMETNDLHATDFKFVLDGGMTMLLRLGQNPDGRSTVVNKNGEPLPLTCFRSMSGLE